jgi:hypothetical protein
MGKITGFLEIERHDRVYAPVEELCVPKTHPATISVFASKIPVPAPKFPVPSK